MLPPGWVHIPVQDATVGAIDRLLAHRFAHVGRDQAAPLRRALRVDLLALADDARRTGALDLYLLLDSPGDLPVDASLLVTLLASPPNGAEAPSDLLPFLEGPDTTATVVQLRFAGAALRTQSRCPTREGQALPIGTASTRVQYLIETPDRSARLLLTFTTTTEPVTDQLVTLFDAMAGTLGFTDRVLGTPTR